MLDMPTRSFKAISTAPQANINTFTFASLHASITTSLTFRYSSNGHVRSHHSQCLPTPQSSSPARPAASEPRSYTTSYTPTTSTQPPSSPPPALRRTAPTTNPKASNSANSISLVRRLSVPLWRASVCSCSSVAVRGTLRNAIESTAMLSMPLSKRA
jgi:hypothetical protein